MRVALFALIFVNLAVFAWTKWLAPEEAQLPVSPNVDAPRLQLAVETLPAAAGGVLGNGRCVTVGPFASNELAARARSTLADAGYGSIPREEATTVLDGYWVYLEAPSTESAERRLLERLRRGGFADARAVGELGSERRISLGVFSDEQRAAAQSERVAKLQLLPQIEAREKPAKAIWLDLALKTDAAPLEGQKFPVSETSQLEFRPCPAPAGDADSQ